jgi:membrane-associated phospholipid phosphatase
VFAVNLNGERIVTIGILLALCGATGRVCHGARWQLADSQQSSESPMQSQSTQERQSSSNLPSKPEPAEVQRDDDDNRLRPGLIKHFACDQKAIWTVPARVHLVDVEWLMPFALATAGFLVTDTEFSKHLSNSPSRLKYSRDFSNYGIGAMGAAAGGIYLLGAITHDDHKRETGVLAGEAALNSFAVTYALKYAIGRERPFQDDYRGNFFSGGDGFPSEHAAAAWSIATVVAHEYPGTLTQILAYGMASAVSVSRLTAKEHFPTDVLVGSAIGWLSGEIVYRMHHDPELGGSSWLTYSESRDYLERDRPRQNMGTTFVELDSWIYPVFDRLGGLGYVHSALAGMRPWTRMECARLTDEATDALRDRDLPNEQVAALLAQLRREFAYELSLLDGGENKTIALDSVYARTVSISGPDFTDGYHFGQTVSDDFGRPFERGTNGQAGGAFRAALGPIAVYVRAEYQHAPETPAPSDAVRNIIALRDQVPEPPDVPVASINRPRLLDAYFGVNLDNWEILVGRQSLSWGPGPGGSLIWSDNIEPVDMVRIVNSEAERLPGFFKYLGPARLDQFFGRLSGHDFIPRPFIYGNKISFKPIPDLEFGFARTVTIGGTGGDALTPGNFVHSFLGLESQHTVDHSVPGDSHASFDWTFNVPKVGNYLVLYGEWYADDDPVPFQAPQRTAFRPGIYLTHVPGLSKLDFHAEVADTDTGILGHGAITMGNLNYYNSQYRDGYTNDGFLIGNTVGRMGRTYQGWLTYWISSRNNLQVTYKNNYVDSKFIPGGGAWQDYSVKNELYFRSGIYLKTQLQYEHISHFPILFKGTQQNITAILECGFSPASSPK